MGAIGASRRRSGVAVFVERVGDVGEVGIEAGDGEFGLVDPEGWAR